MLCFSPILPRETGEDSFGMKLIQELNSKKLTEAFLLLQQVLMLELM